MDGKWEIIDEREIDRAEQLIWEGRYDEARQLLTRLNNEPARQLLTQIPVHTPPQTKPKDKARSSTNVDPETGRSIVILVFVVIVMVSMFLGIINAGRSSSGRYSATARPYATTNPSLILLSCIENGGVYADDCFARNFAYDQCRARGHDASYCQRQVNFTYP